ncbi:YaeF family permuted papain-like enzyme [Kingella denitrificans]
MKWNNFAALCAAVWLSACATEWQKQHAEDGRDVMRLQTVRNSTLPESGMIKIGEQDLQAGDILFSSEASVQSLGIRLFSNAAVSHVFLYLGDGEIAEAVGAGVRIRRLDEALKESNLTAAFRRPDLTEENIAALRDFARQQNGRRYNFLGIVKQVPYSLARNACELPVIPRRIRRFCLNTMAAVMIPSFGNRRFFCSQFVIEAFNRAGKPLTSKSPEWLDPADILHMREGDVATFTPKARLNYVGHLQCSTSIWNADCHENTALPLSAQQAKRYSGLKSQ